MDAPSLGPNARVLLTACLATLALPSALAETFAPGNDDFADAQEIVGALFAYHDRRSTVGATMQPGEEGPCGIESSVWYSAGALSGLVGPTTVDTYRSNFDTSIAVWKGESLDDLTLVTCKEDTVGAKPSILMFTALPTETYFIQIGGQNGETGTLDLEIY